LGGMGTFENARAKRGAGHRPKVHPAGASHFHHPARWIQAVTGMGGGGFFPSCVWVWGSLTRWVCRMDLPGPTTSVGTRTDYSVGPWDYTACATRQLTAWSTRTTEEKYSVRKLCMSRAVWKTPIRTRLVLSPYSDL
jgi:hypothetical protein